jgi:hypothetical protein
MIRLLVTSVPIYARAMGHVRQENTMRSDPHRLHYQMGGDAADGLTPRLPAPVRCTLVRTRGVTDQRSSGLLLVGVFLRRSDGQV